MTPSATLDALPQELLKDICTLVDAVHRPSLYALSLVCKSCRCAASPLLFRSLHLDIRNSQQLCDDVVGLSHGLQAFDSFRYVRSLRITGELRPLESGDLGGIEGPSQYLQYDEEAPKAWDLFARLLERLSALEELHFKSRAPLPPIILAALHSQPESCRLHLHDFCPHVFLSGSLGDTGETARLDPYALQLLTSAKLYHVGFCHHKITCTADERMARDEADYVIEAVLELALRYSPNLKEIVCLWRAIPDFRYLPGREVVRRSPWSGLLLEYDQTGTPLTKGKRKLTSLTVGGRNGVLAPNDGRRDFRGLVHYGGRDGIDHYMIDAWDQRVDFAALRTLKLVNHLTPEARRRLRAKMQHFVSLSVLQIYASEGLDELLHALRPLIELEILGEFGHTIPRAVFDQHGQMLRLLSLLGLGKVFEPYIHEPATFVCWSGTIKEFGLRCPVLEELTILIQRAQGDPDELAIYQELGAHSHLQKIHLTLECSVDARGEPSFEDFFDEEPFEWPERGVTETRDSHIFQSLKNCAVDKPLVAAIFSTIAAAKPPASKPLERLTIQVSNAGKFVDNERRRQKVTIHPPSFPIDEHTYLWEPIFDHFTRKWIAVPNHNIDCQDEVAVEEDMEAFVAQHREERDWYDQSGKDPVLGSVEPHFRALWPDKLTGDPRNEWHSFPLGEVTPDHQLYSSDTSQKCATSFL
jgi:hypothetical protein